MTEDPDDFLLRVMDTNPSLAGRAAAAPELRRRLSDELLQRLGQTLIARSRDPEIDLRERIACGLALGQLGDPRLVGAPQGPDDSAAAPLLPSTVEITQGEYSIGGDAPIEWTGGSSQSHLPQHSLRLARFTIARMAVSNAEWDRFMRAGGYEDPRWWDTPVGQAWRRYAWGDGLEVFICNGVESHLRRTPTCAASSAAAPGRTMPATSRPPSERASTPPRGMPTWA